jgi:large subunit ribosomal protein L6
MSKIGRKPINVDGITINIQGQSVHYKGPKAADVYVLPDSLIADLQGKSLFVKPNDDSAHVKSARTLNCVWGLHYALLKNKIQGSIKEFEKKVKIVGLGCKAEFANRAVIKQLSNKKYVVERDKKTVPVLIVGDKFSSAEKGMLFILGKSHFFYFIPPLSVTAEIDKTGQNLLLKSIDPVELGLCVSKIKQLRKVEPYKGTGIHEEGERIIRKPGKTKAG